METYNLPFVYFMVRIMLGSLFFFQAYDKIFRIGLNNVFMEVNAGASEKKIPGWFSKISVYLSSYIELAGGILLIAGLMSHSVLYLLGIHLMMVTIGFGYLKGIWDTTHVFARLILLLILFLLPQEWNTWSLDHLL